jgi:hypothetical protein
MNEPQPNQLANTATPNTMSGNAGPKSPQPPTVLPAPTEAQPPTVPWLQTDAQPKPQQSESGPGGGLRRLANPWVARLALVGAIGLGGVLLRDFVSGSPDALRPGDCIDTPAMDVEIEDVQHHPCDQGHTAEVFSVFEYAADSGAPYPDDPTMDNVILPRCYSEFATYTGTSFDDRQELDMSYLVPTSDGWGMGDRSVICILMRVDAGSMTSSMRNSAP